MKRKVGTLLLTIFSSVILTGCWDNNEPEQMVYAQGMGLDYKDGRYILYIQNINLSVLAKSEAGGGGGEPVKVEVGHASGKTFDEAAFNLYNSSQKRIFFGHLAFFVFSKSALEHEGIKTAVDILDRYRETRYQIWFYATKQHLNELLSATPMYDLSSSLSRLSDPTVIFEQRSFIRPIDMRELILQINEPGHEVNIPFIELAKEWKTDQKTDQGFQVKEVAVVNSTNLKAILKSDKVKGLSWMEKDKFVRDHLWVRDKNDSTIDLVIEKKKVKIKPVRKVNKVQFAIDIKAKANITRMNEKTRTAEISALVENKIKKDILETYKEGLKKDIDIYRLSEVVYKKDVQSWKQLEKKGKVPLEEDSLNVKVDVKIVHGIKQRLEPTLN
jgi:spore germination protein KC